MNTVLKNPELYDLLYKNVTDDINFYHSILQNVGEIVEYGAGSGRITIPLAKQNHKVLAVDNEPIMLKRLEEKLTYLSQNIRLRIQTLFADIVDLKFEKCKECILVPFTTFNYLLDKDIQLKCLKNISGSLINNGLAVFELITLNTYPELFVKSDFVDVDTLWLSDGSYYKYSRATKFKINSNILRQERVFDYYSKENIFVERHKYDWVNCYISLKEFRDMASICGFQVYQVYGDTSFADYIEDKSNDLFIILKKIAVS